MGLSALYIRLYDYIIHVAALCMSLITSFQHPLVRIQAGHGPQHPITSQKLLGYKCMATGVSGLIEQVCSMIKAIP